MHLAIVSPYPPAVTGIGQYGFHLSRAIAQAGVFDRITILTGKTESLTPAIYQSSQSVEYVWKPERLDAGFAILSHLSSLQPDLVWFNLGASVFGRSPLANLSGLLSPGISFNMGYPTMVTLHEVTELTDLQALHAPGGALARMGARWLTRIAARGDVVCVTMRQYLDWFTNRRPDVRCVHIPIGAYHPPEILPDGNDGPELLVFTTIAPYKGLELVYTAHRLLLPCYPNLRLTIAGAEHARFPGYAEQLRQKFASLPGVRWLGQVHENQVRELFHRSQVIVLPYKASTGSSSVLYQAAMWGRPILASDLPEIQLAALENGLDVEYFIREDAVNLADKLQMLFDHPNRRREQVQRNFTAIQRFHPKEICRQYLHAFNLTLELHKSPKRLNIPANISLESA